VIAAGIDIGTNTILMVVADIRVDGTLKVLDDLQEIPRLGKDVDATGRISSDSVSRAVDVLRGYRTILDAHGKPPTFCVATSAVRDATNRDDVVAQLEAAIDEPIRMLSGREEAELTFKGTVEGGDGTTAVIDIGGGSTEIAIGTMGSLQQAVSVDIGCVRLTERWYAERPLSVERRAEVVAEIRTSFQSSGLSSVNVDRLIAVAGTPTALAVLHTGLDGYSPAVHGVEMSRSDIQLLADRLQGYSVEELTALTMVDPRRADILPAGALILLEAMQMLDVGSMTVSIRGLRYGALYTANRAEIRT
jgi:exopolyphosphatase / guanosine-5'-triphosphate,3'-diphosphate pyrophosphatase